MNNYFLYRDLIKTGDVISFSGKGRVSSIIKWATNSDLSHVGLCIWLNLDTTGYRLFFVESTTLNKKPDVTGEFRRGVQMMPLSQRIDGFDGKAIYWHPLHKRIADEKQGEMVKWLLNAHTDRVSYDTSQAIASGLNPENWNFILRMLAYPFGSLMNANPNLDRLFCSELCVAALQKGGVLPEWINPSEVHPEELVNFDVFQERILLCK